MTDRLRNALRAGAQKATVPPMADGAIRSGRRLGHIRKALASGAVGVTALGVVGGYTLIQTGAVDDSTDDMVQSAEETPTAQETPQDARPVREPAALPDSCTLDLLPVPDGTEMSDVAAMDSTGDIIVGEAHPEDDSRLDQVVLWRDRQLEILPETGTDIAPGGVNADAVVVGSSYVDSGERAWIYRDGQMTDLPGDGETSAKAINNRGDVVGFRHGDGASLRPVLWPKGGDMVDLQLPDWAIAGEAWEIDDDGSIVGYVETPATGNGNYDWVPYMWSPDGVGTKVPMPTEFDDNIALSSARAIGDGWIGISLRTDDGEDVGLRWDSRSDEDAVVIEGMSEVDGVNHLGWIAGVSQDRRAVLSNGRESMELPGLIDDLGDYAEDGALTISDDGRILAGRVATHADLEARPAMDAAVVWTCE